MQGSNYLRIHNLEPGSGRPLPVTAADYEQHRCLPAAQAVRRGPRATACSALQTLCSEPRLPPTTPRRRPSSTCQGAGGFRWDRQASRKMPLCTPVLTLRCADTPRSGQQMSAPSSSLPCGMTSSFLPITSEQSVPHECFSASGEGPACVCV